MADINIIKGNVIIPEMGVQRVGISIEGGEIISIASEASLPSAAETIDASGMYVLPGLIDPHVHLGFSKGFEADCRTETRSALVGGITTVGCYLGVPDPYSTVLPGIEQQVNEVASADVVIHVAINTPEQMKEIPRYASDFGINTFKFYMFGVPGLIPSQSNAFILEGFREVAKLGKGALCCVHAEDASMTGPGWEKFAGVEEKSLAAWAECNPDESEELAVIIASYLADRAKVRVNILHLCTALSVERLRQIKKVNPFVNAEAFNLALSINKHSDIGLKGRWAPAVRGPEDQEALWAGIKDDTIDTIGCDSISVDMEGFERFGGMGGSAADALMFSWILTEGYHKRGIPLEKLVEKCTINPARLLGIYPQKGAITVGSDADLAIVDVNKEFEVDYRKLHSVSDWNMFQGKKLKGQSIITIKSGKIAYREGEILVEPGLGIYLRRKVYR
ncbi:MAG TPA: dihydroorotase family protein [Syntrophales bacterium]|nr:dihydroorotase family protein [Syntrophales bacterium]